MTNHHESQTAKYENTRTSNSQSHRIEPCPSPPSGASRTIPSLKTLATSHCLCLKPKSSFLIINMGSTRPTTYHELKELHQTQYDSAINNHLSFFLTHCLDTYCFSHTCSSFQSVLRHFDNSVMPSSPSLFGVQ